ncbi:type VI secretion system-associated FHA domain protein TagH [Luteibacter sp. 329MFSha]|uniref:type VI secretion system-associated FHA domain protein TagH n=1 Tax=Luteibacter sp. 329MFSha TaxID=1798239 RepID=UPI0008B68CC7|nr:type VI secretion system-associated FHA domain protein TagH [Luteibacter sp. 329MFSha]SEW01606.1 FHA domain protein [Luteibacter sp. 329MFSha]
MNRFNGPSLVLSVLGTHVDDIAERTSVRVEGEALTIGRADQCDWVLHAQGVSRQHAIVRFLNGMYFLEDRSTNGMLLNGEALRGEPAVLRDGDVIQIDTFEVLATVESPVDVAHTTARRASADTARTVRLAAAPAVAPPVVSPLRSPVDALIGEAGPGGSVDPLAWFQTMLPVSGEPRATSGDAPSWAHASPMEDHLAPPRVDTAATPSAGAVLPEHWDSTRSVFVMPDTSAVPTPAANESASVASVPPAAPAPSPEREAPAPARAGLEPLFLRMLDGVMDVLRARAELKNGFRMPATLIRRSENNPLKFAPTATEALDRLLAAPNDAFLSGEAAVADAMDDIRLHQVALLAGVRAAFDDLIAQIDPARFEEGGARRSRFAFGAAKGPWERYRAFHEGLAADPEERFRRLFGDEFARAYEDQLARFKRDGATR